MTLQLGALTHGTLKNLPRAAASAATSGAGSGASSQVWIAAAKEGDGGGSVVNEGGLVALRAGMRESASVAAVMEAGF